MILVTIDNSRSKIDGLNMQQFRELRDLMSYTTGPTHNYYQKLYARKISLLNKKGEFPTGIIYLVWLYLQGNSLAYEVKELRKQPKQSFFPHLKLDFTPHHEQREAVVRALTYHRGIISASTGVGKSLIITLMINSLKVPTLVVVPSLELKRQLTESLQRAFGEKNVGKARPIWVENVDSLKLNKEIIGYDSVIIDEFHHSGAKTYRKLNDKCWNGIYYRFGVTATPFRSQDHEKILLESVLAEVIYEIEYSTAVEKGYIVPMEAYYIDIPHTKISSKSWREVYSTLVVNNEARNNLIHKLLIKLHANKLSTLCLVKEISHGNILGAQGAFPFVSGQNDERHLIEGFSKGEIKTLVGTTGVIGEGVDTKPCEYVIIAGLGKSRNAFMQQCGRAFRTYAGKESCKVIIFRDVSHKWTRDHFNTQYRILVQEYDVVPLKLEI